ncbi:MAG: ribonuclease J [Candidatus Pacebacteria bacterium]|nr:ribonuclease J [Candidatus Paceibacterota bacterium]
MSEYKLNNAIAGRNELLFVPLGGCGEIGMNLNLFFYDGKWLMVDLGVSFGEKLPGIDVVMPDPSFIEERRDNLVGLVLTHGHEDHIGAIPHLWRRLRCPIYATPFTAALVRRKLDEAGITREVKLHIIPAGGSFDLAPFSIEYVPMTHSIVESHALAITTPVGTVLHSGDWKFDPSPQLGAVSNRKRLEEIGKKGVVAMIGDSTNVFKQGVAGSEADVKTALFEVVKQAKGRVAIACFASNVARVQSAAEAGRAAGRQVALVGRSMWRIDECARETGYWAKMPHFLSEDDIIDLPPEKVLMICTGSQGEPRAALARIANGTHQRVFVEEGDTVVFSSRIIPGNEKEIYHLQDQLIDRGVHVLSDEDHPGIHVSGHPARDELLEMMQLVKPLALIPVHGEPRHLAEHITLAESAGIKHPVLLHNGEVLKLAPGVPTIIDQVNFGRLALDGNRLLSDSAKPLQERKRMNESGLAVVTLVIDDAGELIADPSVSLHGLADPAEVAALVDQISEAVGQSVDEMSPKDVMVDHLVIDRAKTSLRQVIKRQIGHRPQVEVHLVRV